MSSETLLKKAAQEYRRIGRYRLSVWAAMAGQGESAEAVEARLLLAAFTRLDAARNDWYFTCTAGQLLDRGFTFWKDDEPDEPPEHYSVDLGDRITLDDVSRFRGAFGPARRRPV
jgi:hypothetical protein